MYAIAFDLNVECLKQSYSQNYNNAYGEIRAFLAKHNFGSKQGSLYYGNDKVTMVTAIVAVTQMGQQFPWLAGCVTDIRILQLVNNDDLQPALQMGLQFGGTPPPVKTIRKPRVIKG